MTIFLICAAISMIGIILYLLQVGATYALLRKKAKPEARTTAYTMDHTPPVSILKPLKGLDDNLFDNLASFCTQDYPTYEVIFCLQDLNDPAYKVAKKVQEKYSDRNISLVVEKCHAGHNPKVNNLIPAYQKAQHPYILISDSNVIVGKSYLREIVRQTADPSVGLVSNLIHGVGGRSLGATLENLHLNSFIMGSVSFLDQALGMPCVIGKSMLMKKTDLEALGGLSAFKDILAEDFIIGREMNKSGKKVVLSNHLISNVNEYWDIKRFMNRHTRWGKLRWKIGGAKYISELLVNPVFMAALPVLLTGPSRETLSFAAGHRTHQGPGRPPSREHDRIGSRTHLCSPAIAPPVFPGAGQGPDHRSAVVRAAFELDRGLAGEPVCDRAGFPVVTLPGDRYLVLELSYHGQHSHPRCLTEIGLLIHVRP